MVKVDILRCGSGRQLCARRSGALKSVGALPKSGPERGQRQRLKLRASLDVRVGPWRAIASKKQLNEYFVVRRVHAAKYLQKI